MTSTASPVGGPDRLDPKTLVVAGGRPAHGHDGAVNHPVTFTSTYAYVPERNEAARTYARFSNPTWDPFEEVLATLEEAELPGLLFGSGMAAIAAALNLVPAGGLMVMPRHSYNGSLALVQELEAAGRLRVQLVDVADTDQVVQALEQADVLWIESPTNPMLEVADVPRLLSEASGKGVLSVVDNTFATPLLQRPLTLGADVVLHSVTKYLSGHSDVILGAVLTSNEELHAKLHGYRTLHGAIASPMDAFLALRGLRTLSVRLERSQANSQFLAEELAKHPAVGEVRYPGLVEDPGHQRAAAQMQGFGSVISFTVGDSAADADQVVAAFGLITAATSLGGVESLAERRARHASEPQSVPENLIRLSVGIEAATDLWADLARALDTLKR